MAANSSVCGRARRRSFDRRCICRRLPLAAAAAPHAPCPQRIKNRPRPGACVLSVFNVMCAQKKRTTQRRAARISRAMPARLRRLQRGRERGRSIFHYTICGLCSGNARRWTHGHIDEFILYIESQQIVPYCRSRRTAHQCQSRRRLRRRSRRRSSRVNTPSCCRHNSRRKQSWAF